MRIGFIGLGRMGGNMVQRLLEGGHAIVANNRSSGSIDEAVKKGAEGAYVLEDLVEKLQAPRAVWVMVPAGNATEDMLHRLSELLSPGDLLIDGGNSNYKDSIRHANEITARGLRFLDVGTSGGIWGRKVGYCLMIGGKEEDFRELEPVFETLAPRDGYLHCGPCGAGHFVKMIHNGIEYGMMQAYAEGFEIMEASGYDLDFRKISHLWNQGSVVRSWLLELAEDMFARDPKLEKLEDYVEDSGEGRWTVLDALEKDVPTPVITLSLMARLRSRQKNTFSGRMLAALRNEFGGHAIKKA
jgi:6-phosphogluconate dehydrogenase